ncbi:vacuolar amino acid transporter 6 [Monosporozyma unispora]
MLNTFITDVFYLFQPSFGLALLVAPIIFIQSGIKISLELLTLYILMELGNVKLQLELSQYVPRKSAAFSVLLHQINPHWVTFFDLVVGVRTLGISIMCMCLIGTLSQNLITNILQWDFIPWLNSKALYILLSTVLILLPVSLTKRVNLIKYSTQITSTFISLIIISLPLNMMSRVGNADSGIDLTFNNNKKQNMFTKTCLPSIVLFILSSHRGIFPVLNESYASCKYTLRVFSCYITVTLIILSGYGYVASIYYNKYFAKELEMPLECFTVLFFPNNGHKTSSVVITLLLIVSTLMALPLCLCPLRASLYHLFDTLYTAQDDSIASTTTTTSSSNSTGNTIITGQIPNYYKTDATIHDTNNDISETTPLITLEGRRVSIDEMIEEGYMDWLRSSVQNTMRDPRFNSVTTLVLVISAIIASFLIPSVVEMSILLGSTVSVIYTFILPGIMGKYYFGTNHWKCYHEEESVATKRRRCLTGSILYLITGIIISVICIVGIVKHYPRIE